MNEPLGFEIEIIKKLSKQNIEQIEFNTNIVELLKPADFRIE